MKLQPRQAMGLAVAVIALLVSAVGGPERIKSLVESDQGCTGSRQLPRAEKLAELREATLCLLNRQRVKHGLPALVVDARLVRAAQLHSEDMGRRNFYAHDSPDGVGATERMVAAGVPELGTTLAENIHWGVDARARPTQIVEDWMQSPGHRRTILNRALSHVGVGIAFDPPELVQGNAAVYTTDFAGVLTQTGR